MPNVKATSLHHQRPKTSLKKKVTQRQLCGCGLDTAKASRSRRSRSTKYAGGWYQPGNTTNLFHHLRRDHPSNYIENVTLQAQAGTTPHTQPSKTTMSPVSIASKSSSVEQQSIQSCFTAIALYEKQSKRSKNITNAITHSLAKDMMP